jgi:hypothetical protein
VSIEDATRAESRARAAAALVLGTELLPGPVPLPDFKSLLGRRSRWRWRALVLGTVGSVAAGAFAVLTMPRNAAPISYVVDGTVAIAEGIIDASGTPGGPSASVHFSEGTEIGLAPGARLRIVARTDHGAALALDRGRARFAVTHRSGARWSVATGPFTVEVIGTRFTLDWSPRDEKLVVDLDAGSIQVRGASVGGPVAMHPGERLTATAADRRVTLSPLVEPPSGPDVRPLALNRPSPNRAPVASIGNLVPGFAPGRSFRRSSRRADLALAAPARSAPARASSPSPASASASAAVSAPPPAVATPEPPPLAPDVQPELPPLVPQAPPSLTLGGGGAACAHDGAQYRFERPESGISLPDFYTLAFSNPRPDRTHSWCGQSSLRVDANFNEAGRRNFFGRFAKETGQVVLKLHRSTDFTGKTVTVHFFVDGPADARFTAELVVVNRGRWVSGPPSGQLVAGRWWTISYRFEAENESGVSGSSNPGPFPVGGTSPVSSCDRLGLAIHSTGGRGVWTGAVYVDDVGWK